MRSHPFAQASATFVATCLTIFTLFIVAIQPTWVTIDSLKEQIDSYTQLAESLERKLSVLRKLYPEYQLLSTYVQRANKAIPEDFSFSPYEKNIRYLVNKHHLNINNLSFTEFPLRGSIIDSSSIVGGENPIEGEIQPLHLPKIGLNLQVNGNYQNVKNFLQDIQRLPRLMTLEEVTFSLQEREKRNLLALNLKGFVYKTSEESAQGSTGITGENN